MVKDQLSQTNMLIKSIIDEDFVNYKKASMYIAFPFCSFKCEKECGIKCCQNSPLALAKNIDVSFESLVKRYMENPITHAIVLAGLEPLDSFDDVLELVKLFREKTDDDIVIYTGYTESELSMGYIGKDPKVNKQNYHFLISNYDNIIIKFGRFLPNQGYHFDKVLGVKLASNNQYAMEFNKNE